MYHPIFTTLGNRTSNDRHFIASAPRGTCAPWATSGPGGTINKRVSYPNKIMTTTQTLRNYRWKEN